MSVQQGDVAIFWDLDKCSIHNSISGHQIVHKIRGLSQHSGIVKIFRGYGELTTLGAPDTLRRRSELQASGVSLVDCPAMNHKSISSQTMIVDMLLHAGDNPPPVTFLIIAGDNDFTYAISKLRLRRYEVVLVSPKRLGGQYSLASTYVDWQDIFDNDLVVIHDLEKSARGEQHCRPSCSMDDTEGPAAVINQDSVSSATQPLCDSDSALRYHAPRSPEKRDLSGSSPSTVHTTTSRCKGALSSIVSGLSPTRIIPRPLDKGEQKHSPPCIIFGGPPRPFLEASSLSSLSLAPTPTSDNLRPSHSQSLDPPWQAGKQAIDKGADDAPSGFYHPPSKPLLPTTIIPGPPTVSLLPELNPGFLLSPLAYATFKWTNSRPLPTDSGHALPPSQISSPLSEISSNTVIALSPELSTPRVRDSSVQTLSSPAYYLL